MLGHICKLRVCLFLIFVFIFISAEASTVEASLININTADVVELDTLPGIGPTYAQRIIDYRNEKGLFKNIEEIQNVSGIGPSTFANIKDLITAGDQNVQSENEEVTVVTQMSSGPTTTYGDGTLYSSVPISSFKPVNKLEIGIGKDRVGVAGSPIEFKLESNIKIYRNSGVVWNFGDGTESGGDLVSHVYEYPGEYVVVLNINSPEGQAVSRINVKIVNPNLEIIFADKERIVLKNNSNIEANLFGRILIWGDKYFAFPKDTIIKAGQSINFSKKITNLNPNSINDVGLVVLNGYANRENVEKGLSKYKEKKILELRKEISQLEQKKFTLIENLKNTTVVVEPSEEILNSNENNLKIEENTPQTASVISGLLNSDTDKSSNWKDLIKRFFSRTK